MSTAHAILIALSAKRLALVESEPETLEDVVEARHEEPIPGLLDLSTHWELLDMALSGRGRDAVLGDAVLARSGSKLDVDTAFEQARVLAPARVAEVARKLGELSAAVVTERFRQLVEVRAAGKAPGAMQLAEIEALFGKLVALYSEAASSKKAMLALLV